MAKYLERDASLGISVWNSIKQRLKKYLPDEVIETWISPIEPNMPSPEKLELWVSGQFFAEFIENNYLAQIKEAVKSLNLNISVEVKSSSPQKAHLEFNKKLKKANLNNELTFENFARSSSNDYAIKWAKYVASFPGRINPLFIYGGTGNGKTHLINAIGVQFLKNRPQSFPLYINSEKFVEIVARAVQRKEISRLRDFFKKVDLLLFDDFHNLKRKPFMLREFLNILKEMIPNQKQIVIASRYPVQSMKWLDDSIKSRIQAGMVIYMPRADYELRVQLIKIYAKEFEITLSEENIKLLARNLKGENRKIRGAIARIAAYSSFMDDELSSETIQNLLSDMLQEPEIFVDDVFKSVSKSFRIPISEIKGETKRPSAVAARQAVVLILRETLKLSLKEIGDTINRSHSTVIYTLKKAKTRLNKDNTFKKLYLKALNALTH